MALKGSAIQTRNYKYDVCLALARQQASLVVLDEVSLGTLAPWQKALQAIGAFLLLPPLAWIIVGIPGFRLAPAYLVIAIVLMKSSLLKLSYDDLKNACRIFVKAICVMVVCAELFLALHAAFVQTLHYAKATFEAVITIKPIIPLLSDASVSYLSFAMQLATLPSTIVLGAHMLAVLTLMACATRLSRLALLANVGVIAGLFEDSAGIGMIANGIPPSSHLLESPFMRTVSLAFGTLFLMSSAKRRLYTSCNFSAAEDGIFSIPDEKGQIHVVSAYMLLSEEQLTHLHRGILHTVASHLIKGSSIYPDWGMIDKAQNRVHPI